MHEVSIGKPWASSSGFGGLPDTQNVWQVVVFWNVEQWAWRGPWGTFTKIGLGELSTTSLREPLVSPSRHCFKGSPLVIPAL